MKNIAIALVIGIVLGAALGWFFKSERVIIQTQHVLDKQHDQSVKLGAAHDKRKEEVEQGIRGARATAGDCDRVRGNDAILQALTGD